MRKQSLASILALCVAIIVVDVLAFYWLKSITRLITSNFLTQVIHFLFWFFTLGLVTAILVLRLRIQKIDPRKRQFLISTFYGLTVSSLVPKLLFVVVISVLYFTNYIFSEEESKLVVPLVGLLSGFLPFFIIIYSIFGTLYRYKLYHLKLRSDALPGSFNHLRIVQISDLHLGSFNYKYELLDKAVRIINNLEPDLIFFTGDLVNNFAWELKGWEKVLGKLTARLGKFSILGNHDYGDYSSWETPDLKQANFKAITSFHYDIGFKLLRNENRIITRGGEQIAVLGVDNWGKPPFRQDGDLEKSLRDANEVGFKILLSHDPSHWTEEVIDDTDIALTLSGHTHGMQAGIRLKNRQWSPIKYKYKHWAGLYQKGRQYLYVNRGLGWMGYPGRLGMRPEITLIELECG